MMYFFLPVLFLIVVCVPRSSAFTTTTTTQSKRVTITAVFGKRMKFQPPPKITPTFDDITVDGTHDVWKTRNVADTLRQGGLGVLPTEAGYGFVTPLNSKAGLERLLFLWRSFHNTPIQISLLCRNTQMIHEHVYGIDKQTFKLLQKHLPNGYYEFVLSAKTTLPKQILTGRVKEMGVRIPLEPTVRYLQDELLLEDLPNVPLLFAGLPPPPISEDDDDDDRTLSELQALPYSVDREAPWCCQVDFIVDAGPRPYDVFATTVFDLTRRGTPVLIRPGLGDIELAV